MKIISKKFATFVGLVTISAFTSISLYSCPRTSSTNSGHNVQISGNLPLTGPVAVFSGRYPNGFKMGIEDAAGEYEVSKEKFDIDFQDNASKSPQSVSIFQKQSLENPDVYISGTSAEAQAIVSKVDQLNIANFLIAFDVDIIEEGQNRVRVLPNFKLEGPLLAEYAISKKANKVFIIALNSPQQSEMYSLLVEPKLNQAGIEVKREVYDINNKEFTTIVLKAAQYAPDVIIVSGFSFHIYPIIKALRANNLIQDGNIVCNLDFVDLLYNGTPIDELKGIAFTTPLFEIPGTLEGTKNWRARYQDLFGEQPSYVEAYAYDTARLIVTAYEEKGEITPSTVHSVTPFDGIVGNIVLDDHNDLISTLAIGKISSDGTIEEYKLESHK